MGASRGGVLAEGGHMTDSKPGLSSAQLEREVAGTRRELVRLLGGGREVRALAWHTRTAFGSGGAPADAALRRAGYGLVFANHAVRRVRRGGTKGWLSV